MIKKGILILAVVLVVIPTLIIINLPDIVVSIRTAELLIPDKTKPYSTQVEELKNTEKSLRNLQVFVTEQKEKLIESEKILQNLKDEHNKIKPIVEADKRIVEAVFQTQEKRQRISIWVERALSFIIGIGASLIASQIRQWWVKRKSANKVSI